uniref:J domain-containing protein n=1 Tax=Zea mays TaxID=4577 RepID=A0A804N3N5_MAIZE
MAAASQLLSLFFLLLLPACDAIYCDEDDCYDLLGVKQDANASDIKKAYYKLSLKHHPDKNPDPESRKLFVKIANAYEILKDESTRAQYDFAIEHPEEVFYNTAQYYRAYYGHKTDPRAVLIGLLLIVSAFQYINQLTRYNQALTWKICWFWRYRVKKLPYTWEDACYLTWISLQIPANAWKNMDESRKEDLVRRHLWEKSNMERYTSGTRKEPKRRR